MKRKTAQRNGSAILWAVLVMLMVALLSAGIILVDRIYFGREQEENNRMQAKLYAESAIELVQSDICKQGTSISESDGTSGTYNSIYVTAGNTAETYTLEFPDTGWNVTVTVNHSMVNDGETDENKKKLSGEIYLTAKVTRKETGGSDAKKELAEVCARMSANGTEWTFEGYYHL